MPDIGLQDYENEIDALIEEARYLEAFAHIRQILRQHPRYMGAYYLLGKTMLEADQPELAIDMFRRVLTAHPEHMMARIGLGLAHQRSDNLNAAIWNLERAYELDPSNGELADELRRLYGRRDGLEPDYIPLNRAGLARLYIRGNRTGRAVEELRDLLTEHPARIDLQLALAQAYWHDGQIVQTSDTCQEILDHFPYCLKANLLLGTLWLNGGQEEGQEYLDCAQAIDLENTVAREMFGIDSLLPTRQVNVERLTYDPGAISVDQQSDWFRNLQAASVTVGISEAPPDMSESEVRLVDITAGLESQIEIPDWLRELGGEDEEEEASTLSWLSGFGTDQLVAEQEVADVQVSAWLEDEQQAEPEVEALEEMPDWLSGFDEEELEAVGQHTIQEAEISSEEEPDWVSELQQQEPTAVSREEEIPAEGEVPDWLGQLDRSQAEAEMTEEVPDWLSELAPESQAAETEGSDVAGDEVPDWLSALKPTPQETPEPSEEMPDWLRNFQADGSEEAEAEEQAVATVEQEAEVEPTGEEVPDWLANFQMEEDTATEPEEVPDWLRDFKPPAAEESEPVTAWQDAMSTDEDVPTGEDLFNWDAVQAEEVEPPLAPERAMLETPPTEPILTEDVPVDEMPQAESDVLSGEDALAWLESLTDGKEEELRAQAEVEAQARVDEILGRTPKAAPPEPEPEPEVMPEPEMSATQAPISQGKVATDFFGWDAFGEEITEVGGDSAGEALEAQAFDWEALGAAVDEVEVSEEDVSIDWEALAAEVDEAEAPVEAGVVEGPEAIEAPSEESDMLSGDDALDWLESLTVGKEEELRAQAEVEAQARVDEILGRTPREATLAQSEPEPEPEISTMQAPVSQGKIGTDFFGWDAFGEEVTEVGASSVVDAVEAQGPALEEIEASEEEVFIDWEALGAEIDEAGAPVEADAAGAPDAVEAPSEESDMLSGDDALAWLESLTVGKEEELRAQAEVEAQARVDEILGRKPKAPPPEPEPEPAVAPEAEVAPETPVAEAAPAPEVQAPVVQAPSEEGDLLGGDDALAWLESLVAGKEEELRAQAEVETQARVDEILGRKPKAPPPEPEPEPEAVPEVAAETEAPVATAPQPEPAPEVVLEVEAEPEIPVAAAAAPTVEAPELEPELEVAPEAPAVEAPPAAPEPVAEMVEPVAVVEQTPADEAAAPAITADLQALHAQLEADDSDHDTRLALARALWKAGKYKESLEYYVELISSGAKIEEMIPELKGYVEAQPQNSLLLRTLGDACMKDGLLEEALAAYNQAMKAL